MIHGYNQVFIIIFSDYKMQYETEYFHYRNSILVINDGNVVSQTEYSQIETMVRSCVSSSSVSFKFISVSSVWSLPDGSGNIQYVVEGTAVFNGGPYTVVIQLIKKPCGNAYIRSATFGTRVTSTTQTTTTTTGKPNTSAQ